MTGPSSLSYFPLWGAGQCQAGDLQPCTPHLLPRLSSGMGALLPPLEGLDYLQLESCLPLQGHPADSGGSTLGRPLHLPWHPGPELNQVRLVPVSWSL